MKTSVYYNYDELFVWVVYASLAVFGLLFVCEECVVRVP